tara:strand:- start:5630 stop:5806 length:177 start_codon:yes stop_codon:yes gene_type:complete
MTFDYKKQIDALLVSTHTNGISNDEVNYALFNLKVAIAELTVAVNNLNITAEEIKEVS